MDIKSLLKELSSANNAWNEYNRLRNELLRELGLDDEQIQLFNKAEFEIRKRLGLIKSNEDQG